MKYAVLFVLFLGNAALANTSTSSVAYPTLANDKFIRQGNIELGGGLSYTKSTTSSNFYIGPDLGYFVTDNLVLGLSVAYQSFNVTTPTSSTSGSTTSLGPKISYFFYENGPFAALASQRIAYANSSNNSSFWGGSTSLGGKYFLNSSIAVGLDFIYDYNLGNTPSFSSSTSLVGGFSTYF